MQCKPPNRKDSIHKSPPSISHQNEATEYQAKETANAFDPSVPIFVVVVHPITLSLTLAEPQRKQDSNMPRGNTTTAVTGQRPLWIKEHPNAMPTDHESMTSEMSDFKSLPTPAEWRNTGKAPATSDAAGHPAMLNTMNDTSSPPVAEREITNLAPNTL